MNVIRGGQEGALLKSPFKRELSARNTVSGQPPVVGLPPSAFELLAEVRWPSRGLSMRAFKKSEENVTIGN